ncbi:sigma 54-interacting transcriptional regulator [Balneolales bacterium ANBcel1]|nr:sigma 54-interacting transcriptional regulator [Balneolales bacterium ANBcel1]
MDRTQLQNKYGIIGESQALKHALDKVLQVAPTEITVLVNGETGVGKDVTARAIHDLSPRSSGNLVIVNCGAIPEGIIESELFGHEKGAYTGAHESRMGYFEQADGGTIFLDEVVDTPKNVQVKLLRILESGEFFRVGSSKLRSVNVRVIAASNKDMWKSVEKGDFREDLYYRLSTININIPPLRERNGDILLIFHKFVTEFARKYDSVFRGMSDEARKLLLSYRWPGNIRELRNVAEQLVILEKSQYVDEEVLRKYLGGRQKMGSADNLPMLFGHDEGHHEPQDSARTRELQLIYRAMLDMRNDMSDMKRMLGTLFYNSFRDGNFPKSLPPSSRYDFKNPPDTDKTGLHDPDMTVGMAPYSDVEFDDDQTEEAGDSPSGFAAHGFEGGRSTGAHPNSGHTHGSQAEPASGSPDRAGSARGHDAAHRPGAGASAGNRQHLSEEQQKVLDLFDTDELPSLEEVERFMITQALEKYGGNRRKAARVLGMSERTLYRKIDQYELL